MNSCKLSGKNMYINKSCKSRALYYAGTDSKHQSKNVFLELIATLFAPDINMNSTDKNILCLLNINKLLIKR